MLAYRSTFGVAGPIEEVAPAVQGIVVDWARGEHREELGPCGLAALVPGKRLRPHPELEFLMVDSSEQTENRIFGFVVIERDGEETWTTQVMVANGPRREERNLVGVEIDSPVSPDDPLRPRDAGVPAFVRTILERLDCDDNGIHLSNSPEVLGVEAVPRLHKELGEDDHHGLVLVAGTDADFPLGPRVDFIGGITRGTVGQAATYVLDEEATAAFNGKVSPQHAVLGGALRTFVPGAQFEDPADGVRHRLLTAESLADDLLRKRAGQVIERRSRAFTNSRPLDRRAQRYLRILGRELDAIAFRAPEPRDQETVVADGAAPPAAGAEDVAVLRTRVGELEEALRDRDEAVETARTELKEARKKIERLQGRAEERERQGDRLHEELRLRTDERDELGLDYAVALESKDRALVRAEKAEREVRRLRAVLACAGHSEEAWGAAEEEDVELAPPSGWPELATWAGSGELERALPWVEFTCDWERALDLDDQNDISWIATTWDILRALNDYGRARAEDGVTVHNLYEYLRTTPDGFRGVSPGRYKSAESETVENRQRYRRERMFRVPEQVPGRDAGGRIYMEKHFVIAAAGIVSPRLYLYDATDVHGYGKVVVGYIGRHLTNGKTN